jgi:hypothetical protein
MILTLLIVFFVIGGLFSMKISLQSVCQEIGTLAAARPVPILHKKKIYFFLKKH